VALGQFLNRDQAPWNLMATTAVIYPLALSAIHCVFWRHMSSDLTMEA
jgi:multiple sugar transport system permease protein